MSPRTSESPGPDVYWIARNVGANFDELERKGFLTFYPSVDDYAFLAARPENQTHVRNAENLRIEFLRKPKGGLDTVTWADLQPMVDTTVGKIRKGAAIRVVRGTGEGLTGVVRKDLGERLTLRLNGYRKTFDVEARRSDVVPAEAPEL